MPAAVSKDSEGDLESTVFIESLAMVPYNAPTTSFAWDTSLGLVGCNRQDTSDCKLMVKGHRFWKSCSQALSIGRMTPISSFQTVSGLVRLKDQPLLSLLPVLED